MISRRTISLLLLALLVFAGLRVWVLRQSDPCDRYLQGDLRFPASEYVEEGTRTVEVPCNQWLPRQPLSVQLVCLLEAAAVLSFAWSAAGDVVRNARRKRYGSDGEDH